MTDGESRVEQNYGREAFPDSAPKCGEQSPPDVISSPQAPIRSSEVRATAQALQSVLSRARVGILHRDLRRRVLLVNDAFCALVGRSVDELDGVPFADFTHPDDVERSTRAYLAQLARAEPFEIEKRYVRPDGSAAWCAVHVSFVLDTSGRPESTITIASDISARREAERNLRESEEHYRHTIELSPQISWTAAPDGQIADVSLRWHAVTGVPRGTALGERWSAALHPDDQEAAQVQWQASIASGEPLDVEYRLLTIDGSYRWFRARAMARLNDRGDVVLWYGLLEDVHGRRTAENAVRDSEERFRLAAQAAGLGIWDYDAIRERREWSHEFKLMLGFSPDVEPTVAMALDRVVPEERNSLQALVDSARAGDGRAQFDITLRIHRADNGAERWMRTAGWRMHASSGRLTRVLVTIRDVTEEHTVEERIRWTAKHDALTGIANRAYFTEQVDGAISRAGNGDEFALILLDVDHLKEINDTVGHDAGDVLLRTLASRLPPAFGPRAVVGRLGGDEFAVLLHGQTTGDLVKNATAALQSLAAPFEHDGQTFDMQATAGACTFPAHGSSAADLMKAADIALYVGKATGRGFLSVFQPAMRGALQRKVSMLNVARLAVRDDLVVPFYQPKIGLADGKIVGFEALLRWRHDCLGVQGPETIMAAFDDMNVAVALSDRMLDRIAGDLRGWLDRGLDPGRVAINLSPAEFRHDKVVDRVLEPFARAGIPFDRIEVEITETVLLGRDTEKVARDLAAFHRAGATIALDDFGTGYASLTHLKAFPVDVIKIDKSFVDSLCEGSDDAAIVEAVIGLAHRLKMKVVAEGVETEEQAKFLHDQGCSFAQGFLFGRPGPAHLVEALLNGQEPWSAVAPRLGKG